MIKKYLGLFFLCQFFAVFAFTQDIQKIGEDFEKSIKDSTAFPYGHNSEAGKYYTIRGFKMYCEVYGQGQPLLIIHGNGGSINNFIYQIPYFSKKYKVIIADSRAQGKSIEKVTA